MAGHYTSTSESETTHKMMMMMISLLTKSLTIAIKSWIDFVILWRDLIIYIFTNICSVEKASERNSVGRGVENLCCFGGELFRTYL